MSACPVGDEAAGTGGDRVGPALLRAVLHVLQSDWRLSLPEIADVLAVPVRTVLAWREQPGSADVDPVLRQRLAALLRLHKRLRARVAGGDDRRAWLREPGADGRTPIERLRTDARGAADVLGRELAGTGECPD